ncbi:hypothetical protein [Bacillus sp. FSL K6-0067]|nr:hypothetical protein [Bacillus cereus]
MIQVDIAQKNMYLKFLEDRKFNVEESVEEHHRMMDLLDELNKNQ